MSHYNNDGGFHLIDMEIEYNNADNSKNKLHDITTDMRRPQSLKLGNIIF